MHRSNFQKFLSLSMQMYAVVCLVCSKLINKQTVATTGELNRQFAMYKQFFQCEYCESNKNF